MSIQLVSFEESQIISAAVDELYSARKRYPEWPTDIVHATAVMMEEASEALNDANSLRWNQGGDRKAWRKELIQTMAMCMRCLTETPTEPTPTMEKAEYHFDAIVDVE